MHVGYIGVGNMGGGLARRLQLTHPLHVFDLSRAALDRMVGVGATACDSGRQIGEQCDVVFLCLQTSHQVRVAIFGEDGLLAGLKPGSLIVDQTTGDALATRAMAKELAGTGVSLVDAPVSGGPQWAEAGTIAIMVGASEADWLRIEPVLRSISSNVFHCGDVGTGHVAKVCNNLMAASQRLLSFEVMALAVKNGLSPEKAVQAMSKGSGRNYTLDVTFPRHILAGKLFQGFTLGLMHKDVKLATQLAAGSNVPLVLGGVVQQLYQSIVNEIGAEEEVNLAIRAYERMADVAICPPGASAESP